MDTSSGDQGATRADNPWVLRWREPEEGRPLFLALGYAGTGAAVFHPWLDYLPDSVGFYALRLPGRESRLDEPPIDDLAKLTDIVVDILPDAQEMVFVGMCSGAIILFEIAGALVRRGRVAPRWLVVISQAAPCEVSWRLGRPRLSQLPIRHALEYFGGTDDALLASSEFLALIEPAMRADLRLVENYEHVSPTPIPVAIHAITTRDDPVVTDELVAGWAQETSVGYTSSSLAGNHLFTGELTGDLVQEILRVTGPHALIR